MLGQIALTGARIQSTQATPNEVVPAPDLTADPFEVTLGRGALIGGAGVGCGIVGAGLGFAGSGLIMGMAESRASSGLGTALDALGGKPSKLAAIGAGLLVGAVAAGIAHDVQRINHEAVEKERIDIAQGPRFEQLASGLMTPYDHNGNGQIDLDNPTGLPEKNERLDREVRSGSTTRLDYDWWDDDWDMKTDRYSESRYVSAGNIWEAARGADQVVLSTELQQLLKSYDSSGDGHLSRSEREPFQTEHPLEYEEWSRHKSANG